MRYKHAIWGLPALWPLPLSAHDAFGDLGPLYQALLHPLADPLQGLLVVGAAVFLARQPLQVVRIAYPAFTCAALVAVLASTIFAMGGLGPLPLAILAAIAGLLAATGLRPGAIATTVLVGAIGLAAGAMVDPARDLHSGTLTAVGGAVGLAIAALLVWGIVDLAGRRLSPFAGAVIGGWVAAVGVMLAAIPV